MKQYELQHNPFRPQKQQQKQKPLKVIKQRNEQLQQPMVLKVRVFCNMDLGWESQEVRVLTLRAQREIRFSARMWHWGCKLREMWELSLRKDS